MTEIITAAVGFILFIGILVFGYEYEHNAKMDCVKVGMQQNYSASDIRAICWK